MNIDPHVARLFIYPIKSLDRVERDRFAVLSSGALQGDRTWALFDRDGNFVNGKGNRKIFTLRALFEAEFQTLALENKTEQAVPTAKFNLSQSQVEICSWLQNYFGFPVEIRHNLNPGFPDDLASPGATIVSTASLEAIASWYPELDVENIRRRFRANIEVAGVPAFWEDQLFCVPGQTVDFSIGAVNFLGVNPCQRCTVVSRDPDTGEPYPKFSKIFVEQRQKTLPTWAERSQFNHFFRLAVNTRLASTESKPEIKLGDKLIVK